MSKTFNADFYVVCATIIPVLFLAVAVQGNAYKSLLDAAMKVARTKASDSRMRKFWALTLSRALQLTGYFIWCAGALGELLALLALYHGHEQSGTRLLVFLATILLVFAVAIEPLRAYTEVRSKIWSQRGSLPEDLPEGQDKPDMQAPSVDKADNSIKKSSGLGWPEPKKN